MSTQDIDTLKKEATKRLRRKEGDLGAYYYIDTYFTKELSLEDELKAMFTKEKGK